MIGSGGKTGKREQMNDQHRGEEKETVVVHRAQSWTEAVVIRGLLESAGIDSPPLTRTDPFPMSEPPADFPGVEILVRESQVEEARRIVAEYTAGAKNQPPEPETNEPADRD
jgi:hypothetical protein